MQDDISAKSNISVKQLICSVCSTAIIMSAFCINKILVIYMVSY